MTLQEYVQTLAEERKALELMDERVRSLYAEFEAQQDIAQAVSGLRAQKIYVAELENNVRYSALEIYAADPTNKKPAPGIGIRVGSRLMYDSGQALEWAKGSGLALKLDVPAFEKIAKATPLPFVSTEDVPTATIAKEL